MDDSLFDRVPVSLDAALTRRALAGLGAAGLAALAAASAPLAGEAKRRKKRKKRKKRRGGGGGGGGGGGVPPSGGYTTPDAQESELLTLINNYRAANGRAALAYNALLGEAAKQHSQDMANRNYFDHDNPEGRGPQERVEQLGYRGFVGETIFVGNELASQALKGWQESPPHNAIMLDPSYVAIGIGRAFNGSQDRWYWTAVFGTTTA